MNISLACLAAVIAFTCGACKSTSNPVSETQSQAQSQVKLESANFNIVSCSPNDNPNAKIELHLIEHLIVPVDGSGESTKWASANDEQTFLKIFSQTEGQLGVISRTSGVTADGSSSLLLEANAKSYNLTVNIETGEGSYSQEDRGSTHGNQGPFSFKCHRI